ncbi:MAG: addiction module antitoxin, partial [Candidatus Dadabacteria bacterium]|nr:addiction module antitoxin [Candidatus Dadabacteria bacterium]NIS09590.1 addiction module antitoxin [Candidatus Dadabacteria bacterium]NIV43125.1 addiction module antitoxin [Candidatus Dadabacteria bacterium]NIX16072.1 addiction module antitoxin [Candidatus Dadabacteria bacterium]NIY22767.1 addiction module antitoxin [Candidatus Dadabacteria bacterium]
MQKKLTISIDETVYKGLYERIGSRKISKFIEDLVRPHVLNKDLDQSYKQMSRDTQ